MVRKKSHATIGLEMLLNNPKVSPFHGNSPALMSQMMTASGMSAHDMLSYVGKKSKSPGGGKKEEEARSEKRLEKLEASSQ
jgi:hypothetical protein